MPLLFLPLESSVVPSLFVEELGPQPPRTLTAPMEILATLKPLQANHIPLIIIFAGREERYQTFIVDIDRGEGTLALDELMPKDGQALIDQGVPFEIGCMYEGARISWTSEHPVLRRILDGVPCYRTAMPGELYYHQRRNTYRASLISQRIIARLSDAGSGLDLRGELLDISANGCKFRIEGLLELELPTGVIFQRLLAKLSFGDIETPVQLRHVTFDSRSDRTLLGLQFYRLDGLLQRQVERYISQLQRESRRLL